MILSLTAVLLLIIAIVCLTKFSSAQPSATRTSCGSDASFLDNFSLNTYKPILRLASQMDRRFLESSHSSQLGTCHRRIQRQLLREYLHELSRDFNRLYSIATARSVHAASDAGNLSTALIEQQMGFIFMMWSIEARLMLDVVFPYSVDLTPVISYIDNLAAQTRELARPQLSYHVV